VKVLVTGGAGYIGSHLVLSLKGRGEEVIVADNLSSGRRSRIPDVPLVEVDLRSPSSIPLLTDAMAGVDAVVHFAALKRIDESFEHPAEYFQTNIGGLSTVLLAMRDAGVRRLAFSSSASVYSAESGVVSEGAPTVPPSPYGETKLIGEQLVAHAAVAYGLATASLRYFNVAGLAAPELVEEGASNLIPQVLRRLAAGERPQIYGVDYPTPDGSCIRDFVHVTDVAEAHLAVIDALDPTVPGHRVYNLGTGRGYSVIEVIKAICAAKGIDYDPELLRRRSGDLAEVVAAVSRLQVETGWSARFTLDDIITSVVGAS